MVVCTLPDTTSLPISGRLSVDTDQIEAGEPEGWTLVVIAEPV